MTLKVKSLVEEKKFFNPEVRNNITGRILTTFFHYPPLKKKKKENFNESKHNILDWEKLELKHLQD